MKHNFEYFYSTQPMDSIDVDDIGNVCLEALNDIGESYYLLIKTKMGDTKVVEYGPDFDVRTSLTYTYDSFKYSESKLIKRIESFINHPKRNITQVRETEVNDIVDNLVPPISFFT